MAPNEPPLVAPDTTEDTSTRTREGRGPVYRVIVWNDPVNLMNYVTRVFQKVFGWDKATAEKHMIEVHRNGRSVVAREGMEKAEHYVHQLQSYSLHATMERDE